MANEYRFSFKCSYMGCTWFLVSGDGETYSAELRRAADDYEREICTGYTDAAWERDVVGAIGLLRREYRPDRAIAQEVVDAFNAWRASQHAELMARMRGAPERYGNVDANPDSWMRPPPAVRGARYDVARGWLINDV